MNTPLVSSMDAMNGKERQHIRHPEQGAFCMSRPDPDDVASALKPLGFCLTFQMSASSDGFAFPAQYHFQSARGTQVIYLAGRDSSLDDEDFDEVDTDPYPPHASRFWVYAGADLLVSRQVIALLERQWAVVWAYQCDHESKRIA